MSDEPRGGPPYRRDSDSPGTPEPDPRSAFEGMPYSVLRRYVSGASDLAERRRIQEWAVASPERRAYLDALVRTWREGEKAASPTDLAATDAAWAILSRALEGSGDAQSSSPEPSEVSELEIDVSGRQPARVYTGAFQERRARRRFRFRPTAAAAAAAGIIAGGAYFVQQRVAQPSPERPTEMHDVTTGVGQRATLRLRDGSTITLGVKSRLRFPRNLGEDGREFELQGMAHFQVSPDSEHPFVVRAAGSRTVDLSTAFVVRAYPEDDEVEVVVTDGSVTFAADSASGRAPTLLTEGEMGRLARGTVEPTVRTVDPALYTRWIDGHLTFDNTPLGDVVTELQRWYSFEIRLGEPSLADETFTASFAPESLAEALNTLTNVLRLRVERDSAAITLHRREP